MIIYKLLDDVLSVKKEIKPYALINDFCKVITEHGDIWICEKVKMSIIDGKKVFNSTKNRFSVHKKHLKEFERYGICD